ncbi:MAG: queuosine precursor transporter [Aggregatilineales bacterium]
MNNRTLYIIVLTCVLYAAAQIFSDIASLRILFIAGLSIDAGTLIYPFTFTLRDVIHKVAGANVARFMIFTSAGLNVAMALLFGLVAALPSDEFVGAQTEFGFVLAPVWRIVIASIVAEVVANLIDTEAYQLWVNRFSSRYQWGRVLASNALSVPVDSAIFVLIAFAGELPTDVVFSIFIANVVVKGIISILAIPVLYTVKDRHIKPLN